jgi:hypothetical protein
MPKKVEQLQTQIEECVNALQELAAQLIEQLVEQPEPPQDSDVVRAERYLCNVLSATTRLKRVLATVPF